MMTEFSFLGEQLQLLNEQKVTLFLLHIQNTNKIFYWVIDITNNICHIWVCGLFACFFYH